MQIEGSFGELVFVISIFVYCAAEVLKIKSNNAVNRILFFMTIVYNLEKLIKVNYVICFGVRIT